MIAKRSLGQYPDGVANGRLGVTLPAGEVSNDATSLDRRRVPDDRVGDSFQGTESQRGASQEQSQAAALWSGWWKLNVEKSKYEGMPHPMPPEGQVRQYTLRPDGFWVE